MVAKKARVHAPRTAPCRDQSVTGGTAIYEKKATNIGIPFEKFD